MHQINSTSLRLPKLPAPLEREGKNLVGFFCFSAFCLITASCGDFDRHTCDETKVVSFRSLGPDLAGDWQPHPDEESQLPDSTLTFDESGHLSNDLFGCEHFKYPLAPDDYNVWPFLPGPESKEHLVSADLEPGRVELKFRHEGGSIEYEGSFVIKRLGPNVLQVQGDHGRISEDALYYRSE